MICCGGLSQLVLGFQTKRHETEEKMAKSNEFYHSQSSNRIEKRCSIFPTKHTKNNALPLKDVILDTSSLQ